MTDADLYETNRLDLVRYATVLIGPDEAEDVISTVVLRVLVRSSLVELDDARAYLFRATLNECRTRLKRRRGTGSGVVESAAPTARDPRPDVYLAVMKLPAGQRAATYLRYWAGLSVVEAAGLMGVRPGTVKRYLHLARQKLKGVIHES